MIYQLRGYQTQSLEQGLTKSCASDVMKNIHPAINARSQKKES